MSKNRRFRVLPTAEALELGYQVEGGEVAIEDRHRDHIYLLHPETFDKMITTELIEQGVMCGDCYDYGETMQNIEGAMVEASPCHCQIKEVEHYE